MKKRFSCCVILLMCISIPFASAIPVLGDPCPRCGLDNVSILRTEQYWAMEPIEHGTHFDSWNVLWNRHYMYCRDCFFEWIDFSEAGSAHRECPLGGPSVPSDTEIPYIDMTQFPNEGIILYIG